MRRLRSLSATICGLCLFLGGISPANANGFETVIATYSDLDEQLLFDDPDYYGQNLFDIIILNSSGFDWIDFHFRVECGTGCGIVTETYFDSVVGGHGGTPDPATGLSTTLDVTGLLVPDGLLYHVNFDVYVGLTGTGLRLFGTPTVVPEPTSLLLFSVGMLVVGRATRRR